MHRQLKNSLIELGKVQEQSGKHFKENDETDIQVKKIITHSDLCYDILYGFGLLSLSKMIENGFDIVLLILFIVCIIINNHTGYYFAKKLNKITDEISNKERRNY